MELIFLAILAIFTLIFFKETTTYKIASFDTSGGPAIFPQYILLLLLAAIVVLMIQKIVKKEFKGFVFLELFKGERGIGLLSLVAYLSLLRILGFTLSTILFLTFLINYLYRVNHEKSLGSIKQITLRTGFSILFAFAIQYIFVSLMHVMLPKGIFF
ncbi:MAG: tripartite tricarboxylate transporter TctB family protein [Sphaerochaetaceae bacterium]